MRLLRTRANQYLYPAVVTVNLNALAAGGAGFLGYYDAVVVLVCQVLVEAISRGYDLYRAGPVFADGPLDEKSLLQFGCFFYDNFIGLFTDEEYNDEQRRFTRDFFLRRNGQSKIGCGTDYGGST